MSSFFRYPGGKNKIKAALINVLNEKFINGQEYREPFFGGGSVGINFIKQKQGIKTVWINDKDINLANLWTSVIKYPNELKARVYDFVPTVEIFDQYKEDLLNNCGTRRTKSSIVSYGFKKLAIHQISYSGLGTKSGGPLGGRKQKSIYKIDCRWSPSYICQKIDNLNKIFNSLDIRYNECTHLDFEQLINKKGTSLLYLDPPYYQKGNDLYQYGFSKDDHDRLSNSLYNSVHSWALSYDDCEYIKQLYNWSNIIELPVNYSITSSKNKQTNINEYISKKELLIYV